MIVTWRKPGEDKSLNFQGCLITLIITTDHGIDNGNNLSDLNFSDAPYPASPRLFFQTSPICSEYMPDLGPVFVHFLT